MSRASFEYTNLRVDLQCVGKEVVRPIKDFLDVMPLGERTIKHALNFMETQKSFASTWTQPELCS